ncbi:MAG TPA: aquaporin [Gaiellaceae bacterium]|nr:aquaporin [Gaiellaceae bacterium]
MPHQPERTKPSLSLRLAAEALGTFLFLFFGFNAIAVASDLGGGSISTLGVAFAFGLGLAMAIAGLGHISGGHFNPAVSLGLAVGRRFPPREVISYWMAQLAGAVVAVLAIAAVYSGHALDALTTAPAARISDGGAFLLEGVVTALFVVVITTVATDDRAPWKGVMAPLVIGLFIFTAADAVGPASGGSFNPARSLAPAIFSANFGPIWIYLLAPLLGGAVGGAVSVVFGRSPVHEPTSIRPTGGVAQTPAQQLLHPR